MWQDVTNVKAGQKFKFSVFRLGRYAGFNGSGHSAEKVELRLETIRGGKEVTIESVTDPCHRPAEAGTVGMNSP